MHSNDQTDDVTNAAFDYIWGRLHTIIAFLTALLGLMILLIVLCSVLLAISKRQEAMLEELLKRTGSMQETSVLINPETRSQVGSCRNGNGN